MASTSPSPAICQNNFEQGVALALHLWPALTLAVQNNWGGPESSDKRDWFAGAIVDLFPDLSKLTPAQLQQKQQQFSSSSSSSTAAQSSSSSSSAAAAAAAASSSSSSTRTSPHSQEEPDQEDVEEVLLQVMLDEFDVNVDDDSAFEVAEQVVRMRAECLRGKFDEVEALRRRWEGRKGSKLVVQHAQAEEGDTDWGTDEDDDGGQAGEDGDIEMGEAPQLVAGQGPRRERQEPQVDEDGFTMVTRKKR
ncbi:hypothetical protein VTK26DRAFT_4922 [Humicola hyalothermophila]